MTRLLVVQQFCKKATATSKEVIATGGEERKEKAEGHTTKNAVLWLLAANVAGARIRPGLFRGKPGQLPRQRRIL
jgi:hypothetical protein